MTFTSVPGAGTTLTGSTLSSLITELRPLHVRKAADETLSNSTTLQNDDELFLSVGVQIYDLEAQVIYGAGTSADFKIAWTFPSATLDYVAACLDNAASPVAGQIVSQGEASGTSKSFGGVGVAAFRYAWFKGRINVATAGTLRVQWAQNSPVVENTVVKTGSFITLRQLT